MGIEEDEDVGFREEGAGTTTGAILAVDIYKVPIALAEMVNNMVTQEEAIRADEVVIIRTPIMARLLLHGLNTWSHLQISL